MKNIENKISEKLMGEWNYKKNNGLKPEDFTRFSNKKVWWKCKKCGYEWSSTINNRSKGNGCPCCAGKNILVGKTDLATVNPELIKEWDYDKNQTKPQEYLPNSHKKVWWKCRFGHNWEATIASRNNGNGCPECNNRGTSFSEQAVYFYMKKIFPDAINRYKEKNTELDIFIPSKRVALEYDGFYYHKNEKKYNRDNKKDSFCKTQGIELIRIREKGLKKTTSASNYLMKSNTIKELNRIVSLIIEKLTGKEIGIDIEKDNVKILNSYHNYIKINSLEKVYPDVSLEWDYVKNKGLTPQMISYGSSQKVWWNCSQNNHSYYASVANRVKGRGCPFCSGQKVLKGFNDLGTKKPKIAADWCYEKNGELTPSDVLPYSNKRVWWNCNKCGNTYFSRIADRSNGNRCNICNGSEAKRGYNDFITLYPQLEKEIHPTKNIRLDIRKIKPKSDKKLWWICEKGHVWQAMVKKRVLGQGCPFCSNKKVLEGFNDLATKKTELAEEWNYSKNKGLTPKEVMLTSNKKVEWKCKKCGYEWSAYISNRSRGAGCPRCNGRVPYVGKNDLATVNPKLAKEWNYKKNEDTPQDYLPYSHKKVWWKCCKCGSEWKAAICLRMNGKSNCRKCKNSKR